MTSSDENELPPAVEPNVISTLVEMLGIDDDEILIELIDAFLNDTSNLIGRLEPEWAANNKQEVMLIAHSMKSTSATFCAQRLSRLTGTLELELRNGGDSLDIADHITQIQQEYIRVREALLQERKTLVDRL